MFILLLGEKRDLLGKEMKGVNVTKLEGWSHHFSSFPMFVFETPDARGKCEKESNKQQ